MNCMFSKWVPILFAIALGLTICPASGEDSSSTASLKGIYETALQKIGTDHTTGLQELLDLYGKSLDQIMKQLQSQGELELLLAVKKEKDRFDASKRVPEESPAGASPYVIKLQDDYRKATAQAVLQKNRNIVELAEKYVARLEMVKKELTVKGQIPDALGVKKEIDRVQNSSPVTAARFALLDNQVASQPPPVVTPPPAAVDQVACPGCGGTGNGGGACNRCGGTGKCSSCNGTGRVRSEFRGGHGTKGCISCASSGQCRFCKGTGQDASKPCTQCNGTGKVPASSGPTSPPARPDLPRPPPVSRPATPAPPTVDERAAREKMEKEMRLYSDRLASMKQQFQAGKTRSVSFEDVRDNPDKYAGELLSSDVHLIDGRPRQIRVATTLDDAKVGGQTLVPASADVGEKASKLAWSIKRTDKIAIIYGVVNKDNFTVFDLRQR